MQNHPPDMRQTPHALILTGGTEATRRAEAARLTAGLLCEASESVPCGVCPACRKVSGHPDVFFLRPEGREIVIKQVRDLRDALRLKPHEGRCHVAVIEADALNTHAQNALLAILEEPPGQARFFLLSENPALLLNTVRSRCAVRRLPEQEAEQTGDGDATLLMDALLSGDEWTWVCACLSLEKRPRDELSHILDGLAALLVRAVPGRDVLTARRFGGIIDQIRILQEMLEANVSAGHVCGALAAGAANNFD